MRRSGECHGALGSAGEKEGAGPQDNCGEPHRETLNSSRRWAQFEVAVTNSSNHTSDQAEGRPSPGRPSDPEGCMEWHRDGSRWSPRHAENTEKAEGHRRQKQSGSNAIEGSSGPGVAHRGVSRIEYEVIGSDPAPERVREHPTSRLERERGLTPLIERSPEAQVAARVSSGAPVNVAVASVREPMR